MSHDAIEKLVPEDPNFTVNLTAQLKVIFAPTKKPAAKKGQTATVAVARVMAPAGVSCAAACAGKRVLGADTDDPAVNDGMGVEQVLMLRLSKGYSAYFEKKAKDEDQKKTD